MGLFEKFGGGNKEEVPEVESSEIEQGIEASEDLEKLEAEVAEFGEKIMSIETSPKEKRLVRHLGEEESILKKVLDKSSNRTIHRSMRTALAVFSFLTALGGSASSAEAFMASDSKDSRPRAEVVLSQHEYEQLVQAQRAGGVSQQGQYGRGYGRGGRPAGGGRGNPGSGRIEDQAYGVFDSGMQRVENFFDLAINAKRRIENVKRDKERVFGGGGGGYGRQ